jgi:GrpB-like predicted nucleotidyltransferase (UPF0157 family)
VTEHVQPQQRLDGQIVLSPYDESWAPTYARLASEIHDVLGDVVVEHVGSTSVPGLDAKPIIDINLIVADSADESSYVSALEGLDYVLVLREPEWHEHRLLRLSDPAVNLHVFTTGSAEHARMISFRDRLRRDDATRDRYLATKRELAAHEWKYVQEYADEKTSVIEQILSDS